jgi:HK97 family phage prohead protease
MQNELSDRYIPLSTGTPGLRGTVHVQISEPEQGSATLPDSKHGVPASDGQVPSSTLDIGLRTLDSSSPCLDFIASDETLDRYQEVISASGWNLVNYQRNPVFQNNHQTGDIIHTLGKALITEVRSGKLIQRIQFATDVNPMAKIAYGLYKGSFLNAVSVGFVPLRWENGTDKTSYGRKYIEQELLEVSAVGIPANPNALALAYKSGAVEKSDLHETFDLLRLTLEGSAARSADSLSAGDLSHLTQPSPPAERVRLAETIAMRYEVAVSPVSRHDQLIAFIRQLHSILKS